jgi:rod shape-determining protein MreB
VQEAAVQAGAKEAFLIEEPMAAAIGAGLPVAEPDGSLVVDVGGGTTEVACIALGGIVASRAIRVGGFDLDAAIQQHVRREYHIAIGERMAEELKISIGSAIPQPVEAKANVRGREIASGLPREVVLTGEELRAALEDSVSSIVQAVLQTLASTPPELACDIADRGIVLTGGSSQLRGLDVRIADETLVPVHLTETPLECVVQGAGQVADSLDQLASLLTSSAGR